MNLQDFCSHEESEFTLRFRMVNKILNCCLANWVRVTSQVVLVYEATAFKDNAVTWNSAVLMEIEHVARD